MEGVLEGGMQEIKEGGEGMKGASEAKKRNRGIDRTRRGIES